MTMSIEKDSARSNTKIAVYIFVFFASVITSIDGFFVVQTYTSIEADGARKIASIAQGLVIVLIGPLFFGASGFFPEYKKAFNALGFAGIFASIVMMALSQSSSDITAAKTAAKSAKVREIIETRIKNSEEKAKQMQIAAENLNKSKDPWHHVLATRTLNASSAPSNSIDSSIKDLKGEKESTPLVEIVGEFWMITIRIAIAVLMNLVHAVLMHTAFDLLRKSFGDAPIGQQILDAIHKISMPVNSPVKIPGTQQLSSDVNPAEQQPAVGTGTGTITVQLQKIETAAASNDASAAAPAPALEPVTAPAEAAPVADKGLKMPRWFTTIFKTSAAATAPLAGAAQFPLPVPAPVPEITPPSISVPDTQNRAAITLKSVRADEPKSLLPETPAQAQTAPADTLKSVRAETPPEPEKEPAPLELELVGIEAKNVPGDVLKSVRQEQPAKAEKISSLQVDTGMKYPFNFRYKRVKKLVEKGLVKPTVDSIKVSDVPCGQDVATRYRDAMVEDAVIERKGRGYVLAEKYQKLLDAKAAKKEGKKMKNQKSMI
jgi:hypothetical protein